MHDLEQRYEAEQNMQRALRSAVLLGVNDNGHMAVWSGGYSFNVYDAAGDWDEVDHFTSGDLAGMQDQTSPEGVEAARERMEMGGYEVIDA